MHQSTENVYEVVRLVPVGQVVSYGDIAELLDISARQVGHIMASSPDPDLPWWRVTNASGNLPPHLVADATPHWLIEGTPLKPSGLGISIAHCRADPIALGRLAESTGVLKSS